MEVKLLLLQVQVSVAVLVFARLICPISLETDFAILPNAEGITKPVASSRKL